MDREMDERNRPLTNEELDSMLAFPGYEVVPPPANYNPVRKTVLSTPTPTPGQTPGFKIQEDGNKLKWENGAIWTRGGYIDPDEEECNNSHCDLELSNKDVLITEEGWGLSSANWLVRASPWTVKFLKEAFQTAHVEMPLFGDQDAMILLLQNEPALAPEGESFESHAMVVPQDAFNSYDALNAFTMRCHAYREGDLLVTFPSCKDPQACNPLFEVAADYGANPSSFEYNPHNWAHIRLFGPESLVMELYREHFT